MPWLPPELLTLGATLMDILDSFKYLSTQLIKIRPHLHVLMEHLHIRDYLLGYAMHQALFRGV
jgi:hypothetical protein